MMTALRILLINILLITNSFAGENTVNLKASQVIEYILRASNMGLEIERRTYNSYWGNDEKTYILFSDLKYILDNVKHLKKLVEYRVIKEEIGKLEKRFQNLKEEKDVKIINNEPEGSWSDVDCSAEPNIFNR